MKFQEKIIIETSGKKPILADVSFYDSMYDKPIVIFCHGYKGFKDWGAWNIVADEFAKAGYTFLKFNFSHNGGTLEDPIDFPDLEAFGHNTYSIELEDVQRVLDFVQINWTVGEITLVGHSRGGGIATLSAAQDKRVNNLVTWAAVSDFKGRFPAGKELTDWEKNGVYYVLNGRTKQKMPHNFSFYADFVANESKLDIRFWAKRLECSHLIIHGNNDEAVSISEAEILHQLNENSQIFKINSNHTFNTVHPYSSSVLSDELQQVVDETIKFIS